MVNIKRWCIHSFMPPWSWRRKFTSKILGDIEQAITASENLHRGELRFVIENALAPALVWRGVTTHQRAVALFAQLGVWDTEENTGILIYLSLADREAHILADRGIAKHVSQAEWQAIASAMQREFKIGQYRQGALLGINQITTLLGRHFPAGIDNLNELSNNPLIL